MTAAIVALEAIEGDTYTHVIRWADGDTLVKKVITGISKAGSPVITAVGHSLTAGWPFTIQSVVGMEEINNEILEVNENGAPIKFGKGANGKLNYTGSSIATDTLTLNDVNSLDFTAYASGGILIYETPKSLSGLTSKLMIKAEPDDADALITLTESDGIAVSDSAKTITFTISAARSTTLGDGAFYIELQVTDGSGVVTTLIKGTLTLTRQTTT